MLFTISTVLAASAVVSAVPARRGQTVSVTPHEQYSSSIGVLGCKINTNRVAYWPEAIDCNNICVKVSYQGRSVNLLKIDQSGGAHDISYDAWNYLAFGKGAKEEPHMGGGIAMTYQTVNADECKGLLQDGVLPLSAANSMNYVAMCLGKPDSWVAKNYELLNILDPVCHYGYAEKCTLNLQESNQAKCPHTLGMPNQLKDNPVINIQYGTGKEVVA